MTFELTEELTNSIISAMENQEQTFVVDAIAGDLVSVNQQNPDENNYYKLPEWKPSDGFSMREDFVKILHSPIVHEELQEVLHSGRGVFKNFRSILKKYPEIDKRWHIYKHRIMSTRINEWYNSLREIWGLEKLDQLAESEESLVYDDFYFENFDPQVHKNEILLNINANFLENEDDIPDEIKSAINEMSLRPFKEADSKTHIGFICRSLSEDFAGCITASPITHNQEKTMILTSLFIPDAFRGLGISTELISILFSKLQADGKKWIIVPSIITPELLEPLLTRLGSKKIRFGYGYLVELQ